MKTVAVLLLTMATTALFAQQGGGMRNMDPEESANRQVETMKEIIKINDKEEVKVKEIFLNTAKEMGKAYEAMGPDGDREAMRAKMTEMNKKRDIELEKVIGKERMETYTKEMEKRRQERAANRGN